MSDGADSGDGAGWPVALRGVTESVVTTRQPDGAWNAAALGLFAGDPVTARTWGETRTRRNFERTGAGYVQFVADPLLFVEAALGIHESDDPLLAADAWVEVAVERADAGREGGTEWVEWALDPVDAGVERRRPRTINRGFNAVVEATVAASRLGVPAYDDETLRDRLSYFGDVARRCGGERERAAIERVADLAETDAL
ncbi:MAG: DUF447 domain-containing protein [Halobacteriaceae archaeon]